MKSYLDYFKKLSIGLKVLCVWTLIWFLLLLPFFVYNNATSPTGTTLPDLLTASLILWAFISGFGIVFWMFIKGLVKASARSAEKAQANRELAIAARNQEQIYRARPREAIRHEMQALTDFTATQSWSGSATGNKPDIESIGIALDDERSKLGLFEYSRSSDIVNTRIFGGSDILEVTVEEHGYIHSETVTSSTTQTKMRTSTGSMVGRAVVGGVLLGPLGAVVGGATAKKVGNGVTIGTQTTTNIDVVTDVTLKIMVNDTRNPIFLINFMPAHAAKNTATYRTAVDSASHWHGVINVLKHRAN